MNTEIIKILCIKMKNREYGRAWLIAIWDVTKIGISSWFMYNVSGNRKWKQNSGFGKPDD